MRTLWILAAAATFAACHNRSGEETGAAPARGDTTGVSTYDTSKAANPSAAKYDTTHVRYDTTMTRAPQTGQYDSTGASQPSGVGTDTTMSPNSSTTNPSSSPTDSSWSKQNSSSSSSSSTSSDTSSYSK